MVVYDNLRSYTVFNLDEDKVDFVVDIYLCSENIKMHSLI
jgi:hypothetical protein